MRDRGRRWACSLLDAAVRWAPASVEEWARAMRAEAEYTESGWEALRWAVGCAAVIGREWLLDGIAVRLRSGERVLVGVLAGKEKSMRRALIAVAIVAVTSVAFWMMPSGRQALEIAASFMRNGNIFSIMPSQRKVEQWRKEALATKNARLLTFVALMEKNPTDALAAADAAVKIDPNDAWVYTQLALRSGRGPLMSKTGEDKFFERAKLYDAKNGVVLAEEAGRAVRKWEPFGTAAGNPAWYGNRSTVVASPMEPWKTLMEEGVAAQKFTTYGDEYSKLMTWAAKEKYLRGPQELLIALAMQGMVDLGNLRNYAVYTVADKSGSVEEQGTRALQVAGFGERLAVNGQTDIEQMMGQYIEMAAYGRLSEPAMSGGYAPLFAERVQSLKTATAERGRSSFYQLDGLMVWNAMLVEIAALLAVASLVVLLLMVLRLVMRPEGRFTVAALWSSAAVFVGMCALCVVLYQPFAALYQSALSSPPAAQHYKLYLLLMSFGSTPLIRGIFGVMIFGRALGLVMVLVVLGAAWLVGHEMMRRARRRAEA